MNGLSILSPKPNFLHLLTTRNLWRLYVTRFICSNSHYPNYYSLPECSPRTYGFLLAARVPRKTASFGSYVDYTSFDSTSPKTRFACLLSCSKPEHRISIGRGGKRTPPYTQLRVSPTPSSCIPSQKLPIQSPSQHASFAMQA